MTATSQPWRIEQGSKVLPFVWLGFWTSILTGLTLTIFRFWSRTMFRRRLWAETKINDEALEYTGKGLELFLGFLIATVVIIAPMVGAILAAQFFLDPIWAALVLLAVYLVMFVLVNAAIFLARRYQFSRTTWKGIRLHQGGSPLGYAMAAIGYGLLTFISFGWYGPAARLRLARRMWNQATFGDLPFRWEEEPQGVKEPVYASFALMWFGGIASYVGVLVVLFNVADITTLSDPSRVLEWIGPFYAAAFGFGLVFLLFAAWHQAVMIRRITQSIRIEGVEMRSRFSTWDLLGLAVTNVLLMVVTLGFGTLAVQMRVWRAIAKKLEIEGALDFAKIQQAERGPRTGEGLADAFDLTGGI